MVTATAPEPIKEIAVTSDPLTGATWTQHPTEVDQLVGVVNITVPPEAECTGPLGRPNAIVELSLDGNPTASLGRNTTGVNAPTVVTLPLSGEAIFEPGTDTSHTLTAKIGDDCGDNGGNGGGHFHINSIKIDVLGAK